MLPRVVSGRLKRECWKRRTSMAITEPVPPANGWCGQIGKEVLIYRDCLVMPDVALCKEIRLIDCSARLENDPGCPLCKFGVRNAPPGCLLPE